ncbi:MAG: DUF1688 family protein [Rhodospirillaceae bacterium]
MTPEAVRTRCSELLDIGLNGGLPVFAVDAGRIPACAGYVADEIRRNYPSLDVPFHSRWRHFELGGEDLWARTADAGDLSGIDRAVAAGDLAVVSVLLDAGAGADWRYEDPATGLVIGRSEGLALASLRMFESGLFSADPEDPLRVDAAALAALAPDRLAAAMQVRADNPLIGVEGRTALLRSLGAAIANHPDAYSRNGSVRPGNLIAMLADGAGSGTLPARDILIALLDTLTEIWPPRIGLGGVALGDVGRHPSIERSDATAGIVPFHKLSQWMSYSLIEPLKWAGADVVALDGLTGLAEYRNGGLFIDSGVLALRDPSLAGRPHPPHDGIIVEWRALTVAMLDRIADEVRVLLGRTAADLPLASVLQGGTWTAGRRIAAERRPGGTPPLTVASDGTVF